MNSILRRRRAMMGANQFPYRFVEYIENAGDSNSYIELDVVPSNTFGLRGVISYSTRTVDAMIFGTREGSTQRMLFGADHDYPYFGWGNAISNATAQYGHQIEFDVPFTAKMNFLNDRKCYINETQTWRVNNGTMPALDFTPSWNFVVLGIRSTNGYDGRQCRIYDLKISSGNDIIRDLRPCYRIKDNEIGLYDMITGEFYGNSGTGILVKGKDLYSATNPSANVSDLISVAATYINQTSIVYNDGNTPIWLSTQTNGIDCSTFIMFCLLGLPFSKSPYQTGVYGGPYKLQANTSDYAWASDPLLYAISRYIDGSSPDESVRLACQIGRWCSERYKIVSLTDGFSAAQTGDLVFYARHAPAEPSEWLRPTWWKHISHVAMVYSVEAAPDTYSYSMNEETVTIPWDKTRFPYKHTIIDSRDRTPTCQATNFLEEGQEDPTKITANNCNTVCLIIRPNLRTS